MVYIKIFRLNRKRLPALIFALCILFAGLSAVFAVDETVPVTSWALAGRVIVIDPGHGGIDPGAVGYHGAVEKDIVLQVSKRLAAVLAQAGAKTVLTRSDDTDLSSPGSGSLTSKKIEDLSRRVEIANKCKADLYLSIHVNAFPSSVWRGAQTFYQRNQEDSKRLAEAIQAELVRIMGNTTRKAKAEDYFTTRNTKMAAAIIEIGFISNPEEARLLTEPAYQRKLVYAIYSGLARYYGEKKK